MLGENADFGGILRLTLPLPHLGATRTPGRQILAELDLGMLVCWRESRPGFLWVYFCLLVGFDHLEG